MRIQPQHLGVEMEIGTLGRAHSILKLVPKRLISDGLPIRDLKKCNRRVMLLKVFVQETSRRMDSADWNIVSPQKFYEFFLEV